MIWANIYTNYAWMIPSKFKSAECLTTHICKQLWKVVVNLAQEFNKMFSMTCTMIFFREVINQNFLCSFIRQTRYRLLSCLLWVFDLLQFSFIDLLQFSFPLFQIFMFQKFRQSRFDKKYVDINSLSYRLIMNRKQCQYFALG